LVPVDPYLDPSIMPWASRLEDSWEAILGELTEVLADGDGTSSVSAVYPDAANIAAADDWMSYFFCSYGYWSDRNCARCPQTTALIRAIPELCSAFFAILEPHAIIHDHRGPWRGQLRYHLGLKIPEPHRAVTLTVGDRTRSWKPGAGILFDDGYIHSAQNQTDERRVVLLITIRRPLSGLGKLINGAYFGIVARSPRVRANQTRQDAVDSSPSAIIASQAASAHDTTVGRTG
jgi:beta-hydroxylase